LRTTESWFGAPLKQFCNKIGPLLPCWVAGWMSGVGGEPDVTSRRLSLTLSGHGATQNIAALDCASNTRDSHAAMW
ncbi:hypothetical protein, partial [Bradyrhizobium sp. CCBAU 11357]|uniref:hypothetical protein n=1 Tax=Bradyrhizobium sp. CCBAU 11357 TaxID=1630808 RepID=UPI00230381BE